MATGPPLLPAPPSLGASDAAPLSIDELYEVGCDLEETDPAHAEASYEQVLARAPRHTDAHINLGRLLHERGELEGAEGHYRQALANRPNDPTAMFNLGVALEDQECVTDAIEAYEGALLALQPETTPTPTPTPRASTRWAETTALRCGTCAPTAI